MHFISFVFKDSQIILKWKQICWNSPPKYEKIMKNWWFSWNNEKIKWKCQYLILSSKSNLFNSNSFGSWNQWERFFSLFHENCQFIMTFLYGRLYQQFLFIDVHNDHNFTCEYLQIYLKVCVFLPRSSWSSPSRSRLIFRSVISVIDNACSKKDLKDLTGTRITEW